MIGVPGEVLVFEGVYSSTPISPTTTIISPDDLIVSSGTPVTSDGFTYTYTWPIPIIATPGIYLIQWSGHTALDLPYFGVEAFYVSAGAVVTLPSLISQTKNILYGSYREQRNRLATAITASDATIPFDFPVSAIHPGTKLAIDYEDIHVWDSSGSSATDVTRGDYGTTATTHDNNAIVYVNPIFSQAQVFAQLASEVDGLSSAGIYQVASLDINYNSSTRGYDLPNTINLEDVYEVRYDANYGSDWPLIQQWDFTTHLSPSTFPSGNTLFIQSGGYSGRPIRVVYRAELSPLTIDTEDIATTTGLPRTAIDLLPLGAAMRLAMPREIKRNFNEYQGDTRRAEEVPAGANNNSWRGIAAKYQQRLNEEKNRLSKKYPERMRKRQYA